MEDRKQMLSIHVTRRVVFLVVLMVVSAVVVRPTTGEEENSPSFFGGGLSDINSFDDKRAEKAIAKWSDPEGEQDGELLSGPPFHWDASVVGRPVFLRVVKNDNRKGILEAWLEDPSTKKFALYKTYRIAFYSGGLGPKTEEADLQAPEGFYFVTRSRLNPKSSYHLSMDIGYPNAFDQELERTGNLIMIHGNAVSLGCFAMTDCSIEQIYTLVHEALRRGQGVVRVHCFPFPMTEENLSEHATSEHYPFWRNLKEGWDWFETHRRPPNVEVENGRYVFEER